MTAEQQLERSVREGKERDEVNAIAQAMSLKTTSRTKKADIIEQILDATGVTSGSNGASVNGGDAGRSGDAAPTVPATAKGASDQSSAAASGESEGMATA